MRRWLPYPLLSACLFAMWLMLTQTFSLGQMLLGAGVVMLATRAMAALEPETAQIHSISAIFRLAGIVIADIVRSNIAVASLILIPGKRAVANFVVVPLDLRGRHGLALLALIITATPGTMWVEFDRGRGRLLVHVLDLVDEAAWVKLIKERYETLIMEIFGK